MCSGAQKATCPSGARVSGYHERMLHIIDGYNVPKSDPATKALPLEDQRHALESRMRMNARALIGTTDYLIVWDGAGGVGVAHAADSHARFTRMNTADDSLVERVRHESRRVCVVTNDRGLIDRCKNTAKHGVEIKPSRTLFNDALMFQALQDDGPATRPRKQAKKSNGEPGIPSFANEINRELKELWGIED